MKKRTASLLVLCIAVCAIFAWQYVSFLRMQGALERETAAIADGYAVIIEQHVKPLEASHPLSDAQTKLIRDMDTLSVALTEKKASIADTVQAISNLQRALTRFSTSAANSPVIAADPSFAQLQKEIGERGTIRSLLSDYNATAAKWNHGVQSELGSVVSRIGGSDRSILPFLRFDGEQEFVPVISL